MLNVEGSVAQQKNPPDELEIEELLSEIARYEKKSMAKNTLRAYRCDWDDFRFWCRRRKLLALPARPDTVALYLSARARTHKVASLSRRLTVIGKLHHAAGRENPVKDGRVERVWHGILREKTEAQARCAPILITHIRKMLANLSEGPAGMRDRALILFGFAGAMRRSELVALNVGDLQLTDEGFVVNLRRSKTDQTGKGRKIGIPYGQHQETCPVRSMLRWLEVADIDHGPIFRKVNRHGMLEGTRLCDRSVAIIIKRGLKRAGLRSSTFSGHSLRAGLATAAAIAGVEERVIQDQTGHRSLKVLRTYIRDGSLFRNNAAKRVGL